MPDRTPSLTLHQRPDDAEVAERPAGPPGTIETRTRAGLQRLRETLRPHGAEAAP